MNIFVRNLFYTFDRASFLRRLPQIVSLSVCVKSVCLIDVLKFQAYCIGLTLNSELGKKRSPNVKKRNII